MPVSGRPRPLSVARPAVGMPSTTVANANAVSSRCQLLRAPARLLYVSILAPSLNGFRNQLLHGVTTPLHACAVGTPIRVHLGLLVRLAFCAWAACCRRLRTPPATAPAVAPT